MELLQSIFFESKTNHIFPHLNINNKVIGLKPKLEIICPTSGEVLPKPTGMTIGRLGLDQFDGFFHGHLDEVTIFNTVVDDDQVVRIFHEAVERMNSLQPAEPWYNVSANL